MAISMKIQQAIHIISFSAFALSIGSAQALSLYEGFDYAPVATTLNSSANGGWGWLGGWYDNQALTTDSANIGVLGNGNLTLPAGMVGTGNHATSPAVSNAYRGLGTGAIDFSVDAAPRYLSFIMHYSPTASNMLFQLRTGDTWNQGLVQLRMAGANGSATMRLYEPEPGKSTGLPATITIGSSLGSGTYLWVAKITTSAAGNDRLDTWIYNVSNPVPIDEPALAMGTNQLALNHVADRVFMYYANGSAFDEIRIADSWAGAVAGAAIPEPSTYGLAMGLFTILVIAVRRKRR